MDKADQELWDAAERVIKQEYPDNLTQEQHLAKFAEDAAFCATTVQSDLLKKYETPELTVGYVHSDGSECFHSDAERKRLGCAAVAKSTR